MPSDASRRFVLGGIVAGAAMAALPQPAAALDKDSASVLIGSLVEEVNAIINSGKSQEGMYPAFEQLFVRFADVNAIARSTLGVAAKQASKAQMAAYTKAFQGYISRKYGRRFREFIGGRIEVTDARPIKSYFEVISVAYLQGSSPFDLRWHVSDKSGRDLFFNIIIEGVNLLASERGEIGAMLDRRGGDIDGLIADLKTT